jgi:hypothetical protein
LPVKAGKRRGKHGSTVLTGGADLSATTEKENDFLFFQKCLNSARICLFHTKITRAPKIVTIFV